MELAGSFKEPLIARTGTKDFSSDKKIPDQNLNLPRLINDFTVYSPSFISTPFKGTCLQITNDRKYFVFGSREGRIAVCDIDKKQLITDTDLKEGSIWSIAITSDNALVYTGGQGGKIRYFKLSTLTEIGSIDAHTNEVNIILLSNDNRFLYSCSDDGHVKKWNVTRNYQCTQLYKHDALVYGMDLSTKSDNLASCASDGSVKVFNLVSERIEFDVKFENTKQWCVKISPQDKYLVSGGSDALIHLWKFGDWDKHKVLKGHLDRVRCLNISNNCKYLVSGGIDSLIKVWNLASFKDELTIYGHKDWVKGILISDDNLHVHTMSDDCTIMTSSINLVNTHINKELPKTFTNFIFNPKDKNLYAVSQNSIYKSRQGEFEQYQTYEKNILSVHFINSFTAFIVFFQQEKSTEIEVASHSLGENSMKSVRILKTTSLVSSAAVSEDGKYLFTGESFRITVWDQRTGESAHVFKTHTGEVMSLAINGHHLFAGDSKGVVKYYHLSDGFTEIAQFVVDSSAAIKHLKISPDLKYLIYATSNNLVHFWSIRCKTLVREIKLSSPASTLQITSNSSHVFFSYSDQIELWTLDCFSKYSQLTVKDKVVSLGFNQSENHLLIGFQSYMQFLQNPLKVTQFSVFGHYDKYSDYFNYVNKIIRGEIPKFDQSMNEWIIEPYHMNILHIYAYFNLKQHLIRSLESGASFLPSANGSTVLTISIEKKFQECAEVVLDHIIKTAKNNPFILYYLSDSMTLINRYSYSKISQLYDIIFKKSFASSLPRFCDNDVSLPIVKHSNQILQGRNKFLKDEKYGKEECSIEFIQSFVKIPTVCGSSGSLEFLDSLIECKNIEIFSSSLIKLILQEKWKSIRWIYVVETILYISYLVILCYYSKFIENRSPYLLIAPMVISVLLFFNEVLQLAYSGWKYLESFWNYIDMTRFILFTYFFITVWTNYHSEYYQNLLLLATLVFSLLRGISYFRIHSNTRWVISLILDVFSKLWAMFSVALYCIAALFIFYYCLLSENNRFLEVPQKFETIEYELFMLFSVLFINPLIILNLFISIVGDSFEKSQDEKVVKNGRDLAELIFEAELLFLCRRKNNLNKFVAVLREEILEVQAQSTPGQRMKQIAETIEELNGTAGRKAEEIEELKKWAEKRVKEIQGKLKKVLEKTYD